LGVRRRQTDVFCPNLPGNQERKERNELSTNRSVDNWEGSVQRQKGDAKGCTSGALRNETKDGKRV